MTGDVHPDETEYEYEDVVWPELADPKTCPHPTMQLRVGTTYSPYLDDLDWWCACLDCGALLRDAIGDFDGNPADIGRAKRKPQKKPRAPKAQTVQELSPTKPADVPHSGLW